MQIRKREDSSTHDRQARRRVQRRISKHCCEREPRTALPPARQQRPDLITARHVRRGRTCKIGCHDYADPGARLTGEMRKERACGVNEKPPRPSRRTANSRAARRGRGLLRRSAKSAARFGGRVTSGTDVAKETRNSSPREPSPDSVEHVGTSDARWRPQLSEGAAARLCGM